MNWTTTLANDPYRDHRLRLKSIAAAPALIDPVFLNTPFFESEQLSDALGCRVGLKVETINPIRSFKGRGASLLIERRLAEGALTGKTIVGASAGNWGQALAYVCRARQLPLVMFASVNANPLKVERIKTMGADVRLYGADFDAAKIQAKAFASENPVSHLMVADGLDREASEGAGTIALEMLNRKEERPDVILVPLGNGAMLTGIARWAKAVDPSIRILGVQAKGADAMEKSWRSGTLVFPPSVDTIADGIAVRVPITEAVEDMRGLVDDVVLIDDQSIMEAMRLLHQKAGLVSEPSGATGLAALLEQQALYKGARVATVICGANITRAHFAQWSVA